MLCWFELQQIRVFGYSLIDILCVLLIAFLMTRYTSDQHIMRSASPRCRLLVYSLWLICVGIYVHWSQGINTQLNYQLELSCPPSRNYPCNQNILIPGEIFNLVYYPIIWVTAYELTCTLLTIFLDD